MRVTNLVEQILRDNEKTRNSDKLLLLEIWTRLGFELTDAQRSKFIDMPSSETIRRIRQKIQEGGKYPATERIRSERYHKSLVMQQNAPSAKPKRIEEISEGLLPPTRAPKVDDLEGSSKAKYIFKATNYSSIGYQKGQLYELTIAKLEIGRAVRILAPFERSYRDLKSFNKDWGVPR
jgi:hypothetical protein